MNFFEPETGEFVKSQCAVADGAEFEKHFSVTIDFSQVRWRGSGGFSLFLDSLACPEQVRT
jgi:hypothetical protein